ncbi:FG-GAP-like repeat-containing protein [Winogradskyella sp.]|uniref:FG-GAP-like repeat-containing protein n=1 Tax=Winogradskyella sp. TaxID=1883156 RepID=UPI003F6BB1AF
MIKNVFILIIFVFLSNTLKCQISYQNLASELGVDVVCGDTYLGNGISFFDYDNDGWDDISVSSASNFPLVFFKNINGNFVQQNLNIPENSHQTRQINWVDIDNDGDNDLFVTSDNSGNRLFENTGNMIMLEITQECGMLSEALNSFGASWGDYNNDGFLDVFISNRDTTIPSILYKNNGDKTFTLVNNEAGLINTGTMSFCSAFFDYNNDGFQDIYVSNDKVIYSNILYKNNGDGTFTDVSIASETNIFIDAMSVTIDDYNSDGWMDIYVTNSSPGNVFFKNNGDGTFTDIALPSGTIFNSIGWGAVFLDADNDKDLDLYVSSEYDGTVPNYLSSAFYVNNNDNTFTLDNTIVPNDNAKSFSNAIGDTDNNGYPEIVVNNIIHNNIFLWKNNSPMANNWLKVRLEGTESNRNGIGSLIEISSGGHIQYRYTLCGEGYLAQNSATEIIGVGNNTIIDYVKVKWLSGVEDVIYNVDVNQTLEIIEGSSLSLDDQQKNTPILVYPNPSSDFVFINSKDMTIVSGKLYDVQGRYVSELNIDHNQLYFDLSNCYTGVYVCNISNANNTLFTFKIFKK